MSKISKLEFQRNTKERYLYSKFVVIPTFLSRSSKTIDRLIDHFTWRSARFEVVAS